MKFYSSEDIQDSVESLQRVHGRDRASVYWIFLFVAGAATISLPLVKVDLSVGGRGQVRPALERISVFPAVEGIVKQIHVFDNLPVKKGDLLLEIDSPVLDERILQGRRQIDENQSSLHDLALLLEKPTVAEVRARLGINKEEVDQVSDRDHLLSICTGTLSTANYLRQYALFVSQLQLSLLQRAKLEQESVRNKALHDRSLISDQEFDQQQFAHASSERDVDLLIEQALSRWQADRIERELKQIDLEGEARQLTKQKESYTLIAPVDGTALGFTGLHAGVFVPIGQRLGEISSTDDLQADVYISPRDIGFIRAKQNVTVQVDAFPYTEWGTIKGQVRSVSQDFVQIGQQLAFKAIIDLEATQLHSSSGVIVDLRQGMTVNARFIIKRRSLFNLLFGKVSEALDPTSNPSGE